MALSQNAYSRIAKQVQAPASRAPKPWAAPSLPDLVARIDAALNARRAA